MLCIVCTTCGSSERALFHALNCCSGPESSAAAPSSTCRSFNPTVLRTFSLESPGCNSLTVRKSYHSPPYERLRSLTKTLSSNKLGPAQSPSVACEANTMATAVEGGAVPQVAPDAAPGLSSPPDSHNASALDSSDSELSDLDDPEEDIGEVVPDYYADDGRVPVFKPTMHQFKDFKLYVRLHQPFPPYPEPT